MSILQRVLTIAMVSFIYFFISRWQKSSLLGCVRQDKILPQKRCSLCRCDVNICIQDERTIGFTVFRMKCFPPGSCSTSHEDLWLRQSHTVSACELPFLEGACLWCSKNCHSPRHRFGHRWGPGGGLSGTLWIAMDHAIVIVCYQL